MKTYRFFYHYHRFGQKKLSVHFKGKCMMTDSIECKVPCESKFNKRQPLLVMRGYASKVKRKGNKLIIE